MSTFRRRVMLAGASLVTAVTLSACGQSAEAIRSSALTNATDFAARARTLQVIDCSGQDSDNNGYVTCTFNKLDATNQVSGQVAGECGYRSIGIGCKLKGV